MICIILAVKVTADAYRAHDTVLSDRPDTGFQGGYHTDYRDVTLEEDVSSYQR